MVAGATISVDLSDEAWLEALGKIGKKHGSYLRLGDGHSAVYIDQSHDVLFVSFETLFGLRSFSETAMPLAFDLCAQKNWSHLTVIARGQDWYRDEKVFQFFDRMTDHGFFDQFDHIVFYGAGMCGYAAGAFSVAAPGSTVLMVSPQATLNRTHTAWDDRFPSARRLDFGGRYAFAPDMIDAAEHAVVIHDPEEIEDAMHASLFNGPNVSHFRYRRGRAGAIEADLRAMSLIKQLAEASATGNLTDAKIAKIMRARRKHVPYLRALLSRVLAEDRPELTVKLCRSVLKIHPLPRFRHQLEVAEKRIKGTSDPINGRAPETSQLS